MESALREARLQLLSANGQAFMWLDNKEMEALVLKVKVVLDEIVRTLNLEPGATRP
jgi:hypothetical protein